jgi:hypothetical protein
MEEAMNKTNEEVVRPVEILAGTVVFFLATAAGFLWLPVAIAAIPLGFAAVGLYWFLKTAWRWYDHTYGRSTPAEEFMAGREEDESDVRAGRGSYRIVSSGRGEVPPREEEEITIEEEEAYRHGA